MNPTPPPDAAAHDWARTQTRELIEAEEEFRRRPPTKLVDKIVVFETWLGANGWTKEIGDVRLIHWFVNGTTTSLRLIPGANLRQGFWNELCLYHGGSAPVQINPTLDPSLICGIVSLFKAAAKPEPPTIPNATPHTY